MYFESRQQAGQLLAARLEPDYRYENCVVVALNDGGVMVGEEIASSLHCPLSLLISEDIPVPGEGLSFGSVSQTGNFAYNSSFSSGEIDEYTSEFHGYLEDQKRESYQRINRLLVDGGTIDSDMLWERCVILTADAITTGSMLDVALAFMKPIKIQRLIVASPIVTVEVVDVLHTRADELHILDVRENFITVDHYYAVNEMPSHADIVKKISQMVLNWQ